MPYMVLKMQPRIHEFNLYGLLLVCYYTKNFNDLYVRKHQPVVVLFQVFEHIYRHIVEGKMVVPTPIFARSAVIDADGQNCRQFFDGNRAHS